jgi:hypothetical protein
MMQRGQIILRGAGRHIPARLSGEWGQSKDQRNGRQDF